MATTSAGACCTLRDMGQKSRSPTRRLGAPPLLKQRRKDKGWSQEQLAEATGMAKASISRIENGEQNWDAEFLYAAAEALGCGVADLFVDPVSTDRDQIRQEVAADLLRSLEQRSKERA